MMREAFDPMKPLPDENLESVAADLAKAESETNPDIDMNDHGDDHFLVNEKFVHPAPEKLQ